MRGIWVLVSAFTALLALLPRPCVASGEGGPLFFELPAPEGGAFPGASMSLRARFVGVDFAQFPASSPPLLLRLNLFDDLPLTALRYRAEPAVPEGVIWTGGLAGEREGRAILVARPPALVGRISTADDVYVVEYAGGGLHAIFQLDPAAQPPEADPLRPLPPGMVPMCPRTLSSAAPEVDLLAVYTRNCRSMNGGTEAMEAAINLEVAMTNIAYENSRVAQRLNLVRTAEVDYTESLHGYHDLANLQGGWIPGVRDMRDACEADVVTMFVWGLDVGGISYLMDTPSPAFADYAFSVVKRAGADTNYAFAHELGHIMGCDHDRGNATGSHGAYPYSYGYHDPAGAFHTIMAYRFGCPDPCPVIPNFSNPEVLVGGRPTGVDCRAPDSADNALTLNNTAPLVAAFRGGSPAGEYLTLSVSSNTPAAGDPFSADVTVQPLSRRFDAYGVIIGGGGGYSFVLGNPGALQKGVRPLARNVPGLPAAYTTRLFDMPAIHPGTQGGFQVIVGLVPAGVSPRGVQDAIPGYADHASVTVR